MLNLITTKESGQFLVSGVSIFDKNDLPISIYLDKFSTYKINHQAAIDNQELMTQFQKAMKQLGLKLNISS